MQLRCARSGASALMWMDGDVSSPPPLQGGSDMREFARSLTPRSIMTGSVVLYAVVLVMVLFPPAYMSVSGMRNPVILGLPFVVFYYIFNAALLGVGLTVLYRIEDLRGELDERRIEEGE